MTDQEALKAIADCLSEARFDCVGGAEFYSMDWFADAAKILEEKGFTVSDWKRPRD